MWTRKEVKEKGKQAFKKNYWKALIVALLLSIVAGGSYGGYYGNSSNNAFQEVKDEVFKDGEHLDVDIDKDAAGNYNVVLDVKDKNGNSIDEEFTDEVAEEPTEVSLSKSESITTIIIIMLSVFTITAIIAVGIAAFDAFLINPIEMGCNKFFLKNLDENANLSCVTYAFDNNYMNVVKVLFRKDLALTLWGMLFVIPGIYKAYEYRMIPYLLAENPNMSWKEAFSVSKEMMNGNKWKAFVLDLSFIGWNLLSILTLGILSIFYVNPYKFSTNAALYEKLKYRNVTTPEMITA